MNRRTLLSSLGIAAASSVTCFSGVTNFGDWAVVIRGLQPALDLATWADRRRHGVVLCIDVARGRTTETVPGKRLTLTTPSRSLLDAILHRRNSRRRGRLVKPRGIVLRNRLGAAVYFGRERWTFEPA